jgi:hypothetical protein
MVEHVTKRTRPDLDWKETPRGMYLAREILQSDAYRALSKKETDLLFFIYSRRRYPNSYGKKKKGLIMDYWSPVNGYDITIPFVAVKEFFNQPGRMKTTAPCDSTITRAINKLMHVGFISIVELGGNGKGDMTRYRLEHNWRVWKKGDSACFKKAGLERVKGFCHPGSGVFCPTRNAIKN